MAAEARAEGSGPPAPPPLPVPEKRPAPADGREEERPGTKRRRASVAALDGVPCAAAKGGDGEADGNRDGGSSFSFQHARGGFVALETTPKFGSFNPPVAAEQEALDPEDSPVAKEEEDTATASDTGAEDGKDGSSQSVAAVGDQGRRHPGRQTESER
ncbi:hypothetical protein CFC21_036602 [Triticum aestivum]|uniref:Uncharacterized protein n=3 Tax=Triticum TaxID=4564 RepID=A0A9R0RQS5_TRITD|nr:uncharacterized protein LOC119269300 [Triticum dicoccoides]XP_048564874.1 uncharacterized protein LOC125545059 [Triticum urartu]KAF7024228.1 hypothetical protein CFC21_036602 [Triticum aestivum]VAH65042.1 unnamed protein product [Triticum turgidum subsp. durum]